MSEENPFASSADGGKAGLTDAQQWAVIAVIAALVVVLGGYLSGCMIDKFGSFGTVALWATGGLAGLVASKIVTPQSSYGYVLAFAVVIAFLVAEVFWIHWNIKGAEEIGKAIRMLPTFFSQFSMDALIGAVLTFFGASSAYRQAGQRFQYVQVVQR